MERDAIDLGTAKVSTLFRKMFVPTLLGMLSISAVTVADGIFVGHGVGSDGIAAINLCVPILMFFTGIGLMTGMGCSVVTAIHLSQGRIKAARLNVTQALLFVTTVTSILAATIMIFPRRMALLLGSSEHLLPMVVDYLLWFVPAIVFQMWSAVGLFIIRLDGAPRLAMWCSVLSALINVVLDWLFIFPLGWGLMGAAFASGLAVASGGILALGYLIFSARTLRLHPLKRSRKSLRLTLRNIGYQCRVGSSALLGELTLAMLMLTGNLVFMRYLGDVGVGAFGIACYYLPFVFMIGNAIAQSAQPIISYNFGTANMERVGVAGRIALFTAVACGATVTMLFCLFPQLLVGCFLPSDDEAARVAVAGFPLFSAGFICFVVNLAAIGYYQSLERIVPATAISLLRGFALLIPSFVFIPRVLGTTGIWLAMPLSEILTTITVAFYHFVARRRAPLLLPE